MIKPVKTETVVIGIFTDDRSSKFYRYRIWNTREQIWGSLWNWAAGISCWATLEAVIWRWCGAVVRLEPVYALQTAIILRAECLQGLFRHVSGGIGSWESFHVLDNEIPREFIWNGKIVLCVKKIQNKKLFKKFLVYLHFYRYLKICKLFCM